MTNLSIKTVMAALLAGSLAATAGMPAFARADGGSVDPAKFQQGIEKRVDKALNGNQRQAFFKTWSEHTHGPKKG